MTGPILPDVFPILDAGEFVLRPIRGSDAADWYRYLGDREVTALMSSDYDSQAEIEEIIAYFEASFRDKTAMRWAIAGRADDMMIGDCGFNHFDWRDHSAVIGYQLSKEYWGGGVMTRAVTSMLRWGFGQLDLNRIEATTNPLNLRSARVLEKHGFVREGTLRDYRFDRGVFRDCSIWGLVRREWTGGS